VNHADFVRANAAPGAPPLVPEITLYLASEVTPLWHATEASLERDQLPPPYWAFAWPGGQALARYLLDNRDTARGKRVLDLGAGCGLAAIAAAMAGAARVVAAEIDPFAVAAIRLNAEMNGIAIDIESRNRLGDTAPIDANLILIGDMCYERPLADRLLQWLKVQRTEIILADPGRAYLPKSGLTLLAEYQVPTSLDLEDRTMRETRVYRLA